MGHGLHALGFILPGETHPGHAVAAHLHDDPADFAQQFRLIGGPQQGLMTFGDRLEGPADLLQGLFHPAAVADIPGNAGGADDFPPFIKNRRFDGFHPEDLALLILNRLFHPLPLTAVHHFLVVGPIFEGQIRGPDLHVRLAYQFPGFLAAGQDIRLVHCDHAAIPVLQPGDVGNIA